MIYENLYEFDAAVALGCGPYVCGADEAGRGPLAGPVACAAVILNRESRFEWLTDSKKVTEKRRERLYDEICEQALAYKVMLIDNETIDRINILNASLLGMKQAAESLEPKPSILLVDGNKTPQTELQVKSIVKGDSISACIAAASVLAKVTRDRFMRELDARFPQYGFAVHKGYPTKAHYEAIEKYGVCEYHRLTFLKGRI